MRDVSVKFGEDAGKIWISLSQKGGVLSRDDLISVACLSDDDFYAGVGWLAREGKISRFDDGFRLESSGTNLTREIGSMAGRVWRILDIWGEADFVSIRRLSGLSEGEVFCALGWLGREGKILVDDDGMFSLK